LMVATSNAGSASAAIGGKGEDLADSEPVVD
jgi:hypothetical protein